MITFTKEGYFYSVCFNSIPLGEIELNTDGFYVYWPLPRPGYLSQELLLEIYKKLKELNEPWEEVIKEEFYKDGTSYIDPEMQRAMGKAIADEIDRGIIDDYLRASDASGAGEVI